MSLLAAAVCVPGALGVAVASLRAVDRVFAPRPALPPRPAGAELPRRRDPVLAHGFTWSLVTATDMLLDGPPSAEAEQQYTSAVLEAADRYRRMETERHAARVRAS